MEINMSFKHIDSTDAIKNYTVEKTQKLKKYFNGKVAVDWNFDVSKQNQIAHCHVIGNHIDLFGEATTTDLYASIDEAIHKLEAQLKKHKEIVTDHSPVH